MARGSRNPKSRTSTAGNGGQVRIISGKYRGRKLPVADLQGLRPTTDRVRETLFNWLQGDTLNARVLDCFAGSGALGLEALSRHAASVTLCELDKGAASQLQRNLTTLGADNATVICGDSLHRLSTSATETYDLVFIDPPFHKGLAQPVIDRLDQHGWLNDNALIYLETETDLAPLAIPANWQPLKQKQAGQVCYRLYQRQEV
ncbi:16S rRNA (guanine(966)-N(2))-methyltransferase RsmD [Ferrimonas sp. SCSIO 43195]|uniref:16S rRNA (guanine(966)-N(2))-methyltransferase RsmD n=1 Tax=Ferrimonas sp. SCSIO 43195 TaxID=2822844 RepID=UPI002075497E|nr:16S rRNA (guanine(966)-N(2))-methyltransferase RsmD [Ferrimonas sp. SCSIO 43195]USD37564.1 16S rRNA (guanine(966)-N(2))-methyltransferase RsmD [Ferrimonas sp. SCSIO 43195]